MIIDTSAVMAVMFREEEAPAMLAAIAVAERPAISAANWFEAGILLDHKGDDRARETFAGFFARFDIEIASVTPELAILARRAYQVWGKGNHPARLNFGDCFAYALAQDRQQPLLFKGKDFPLTDIVPALGAA